MFHSRGLVTGPRLCVLKRMRRITAIEVQKKNPNRVSIYLDDQFAFGLARIVAAWLKVGQTLSEEKITALQTEDEREVAVQKALNYLSYRPRSSKEIRDNLHKHEFSDAVIESTLERLQRAGLVNDIDFARAWVENRSTFRPRSRRALAMELRQKGLSDETIRETLTTGVDEHALALQAAQKYVRKLDGLDWIEFRKKLSGFLGRRGFSYGVLAPVVREVWDALHPAGGTTNIDDEDEIA